MGWAKSRVPEFQPNEENEMGKGPLESCHSIFAQGTPRVPSYATAVGIILHYFPLYTISFKFYFVIGLGVYHTVAYWLLCFILY
jgi:hypothetical protein